MITQVVSRLWLMSLQAGILILIVLAVRIMLRNYLKIYSYVLWIFVGIRLLCPVFVESSVGLQPAPEQMIVVVQDLVGNHLPGIAGTTDETGENASSVTAVKDVFSDEPVSGSTDETGTGALGEIAESAGNENFHDVLTGNGVDTVLTGPADGPNDTAALRTGSGDTVYPDWLIRLFNVLSVGYLAGITAVSAFYLLQYLLMRKKLSTAVRTEGNVWYSSQVSSPFVMGLFHARICLPEGLSEEEAGYILLHERTHIRHHDPAILFLGSVCICLHWWNPLVWVAVSQMHQDMEMFCDEASLKGASLQEKKAYANTLLSFAWKQNGFAGQLSFGESHTEKRVKSLFSKRKRNLIFAAFLVLLVGVCMATFMTVRHGEAADKPVILPDQFAVMGGVPYYVKDGMLYQSSEDGWISVEEYGQVRRILDDETISGLDADGTLFYEYDLYPSDEEYTNLSYGITLHMGRKLEELNEQYPFASIDRGFPQYDLIALLDDGTILFPVEDDYVEFQIEEMPVELSGGFVLTQEGNVFYLKEQTVRLKQEDNTTDMIIQPGADCLYSEGDIAAIEGSWTTDECMGLKADGTAVSWSMMSNFDPLPVSDWTDIVAVKQGHHFAVGLTSRGEVLYASLSEDNQARMQAALSEWEDIVAITIYYMEVYGLKADGSVVSMEISLD